MWTCFVMMARCTRNMRPIYTASDRIVKLALAFSQQLRTLQVPSRYERYVDVSGRGYPCTSTEESSRLRASASLRVKTSLCTRAIFLKHKQMVGLLCRSYLTHLALALSFDSAGLFMFHSLKSLRGPVSCENRAPQFLRAPRAPKCLNSWAPVPKYFNIFVPHGALIF